jgi:beta-lactamase superfamily II metal-dependent hydrolase
MYLEVFDVEHGACALITTSNGKRVMIDCGHNSTTGWKPSTELIARGIWSLDQLIVSNYDEDHVSGFPDLVGLINIKVLARNASVSTAVLRTLKSQDGMDRGIAYLCHYIDNVFNGGPPVVADNDYGDTSFTFFRNTPGIPPFGFDDENNLSLVTFVTCGAHRFIFPGDMEKAGWRALLHQNPLFRVYLNGVSNFVASHHGRENGYLEDVMTLCPHIQAVIISDKKMGFQSQETVDQYRNHAKGFRINGGERRVLTTRRDGYMRFDVSAATSMCLVTLSTVSA